MNFTVLIPARLGASRLPRKPLADLGGLPLVVRVAQRAALSTAVQVVVAADHAEIVHACAQHGVAAVLTREDHTTGSDRLAEACELLGLKGDDLVVNVQGDEPLIEPALIDACAQLLAQQPDCVMGTAAHVITTVDDYTNPNVVKVVLDSAGRALYFSRAPVPAQRDGVGSLLPSPPPLRHIGIYAYQTNFLQKFAALPRCAIENAEALEQLRALWHGERIAVYVTAIRPGPGVDTPQDLEHVRALMARATV